MKHISKTYKYLHQVLEYKNAAGDPVAPVRDAFLLVLDDYYKKKINIYELSKVVTTLWKLEYFTENIEGLDPDLYFSFDLLAYIPPKKEDIRNYKDYDTMTEFIKKYYDENKTILGKYQKHNL